MLNYISLKKLKRFDLFKAPVNLRTGYGHRIEGKDRNKRQSKTSYGSLFGFGLSLIMFVLLLMYFIFLMRRMNSGKDDIL